MYRELVGSLEAFLGDVWKLEVSQRDKRIVEWIEQFGGKLRKGAALITKMSPKGGFLLHLEINGNTLYCIHNAK